MQANSYVLALATIILGAIVAKVYLSLVRKISARMRVDKSIAKSYELPISIIIFFVALRIALDFITLPANISAILTQMIIFVIAILGTYSFAQFLEAFLRRILLKVTIEYEALIYAQLLSFFGSLLKGALLAIVTIIVLANFGYDVIAMLAGFGIFGLAVALAFTDILKDALGGLFICVTRPFVVNDTIDIEGIAHGKVEKIDLLYTRLRDESGNVITIPNSRVRGLRVTAFVQPEVKQKSYEKIILNLPYSIPASQISKLTKAILAQIKGTRGCADPSIKVNLSDKIGLTIAYAITDVEKANLIRNKINMKIKRELEREKIVL